MVRQEPQQTLTYKEYRKINGIPIILINSIIIPEGSSPEYIRLRNHAESIKKCAGSCMLSDEWYSIFKDILERNRMELYPIGKKNGNGTVQLTYGCRKCQGEINRFFEETGEDPADYGLESMVGSKELRVQFPEEENKFEHALKEA